MSTRIQICGNRDQSLYDFIIEPKAGVDGNYARLKENILGSCLEVVSKIVPYGEDSIAHEWAEVKFAKQHLMETKAFQVAPTGKENRPLKDTQIGYISYEGKSHQIRVTTVYGHAEKQSLR